MWAWLKKEAGYRHVPALTLALIVSYVAWCGLLAAAGAIPEALLPDGNTTVIIDASLLVFLASSAFMEEVLFRAPLLFAVRVLRHPYLVALTVIVFSCAFGYVHHAGVWSIPVQGMFGIMISVMYLKCGGANGKLWKPLLCTTLAHLMNNVVIFTLAELVAGGG